MSLSLLQAHDAACWLALHELQQVQEMTRIRELTHGEPEAEQACCCLRIHTHVLQQLTAYASWRTCRRIKIDTIPSGTFSVAKARLTLSRSASWCSK